MYVKPLSHNHPVGRVIQYRDGGFKVKTREKGLVPLARHVAEMSGKVINGGQELEKGWRVHHLDMSTYGTEEHDAPANLVVLKCRTHEFKILKAARIVKDPKPNFKPIAALRKEPILR